MPQLKSSAGLAAYFSWSRRSTSDQLRRTEDRTRIIPALVLVLQAGVGSAVAAAAVNETSVHPPLGSVLANPREQMEREMGQFLDDMETGRIEGDPFEAYFKLREKYRDLLDRNPEKLLGPFKGEQQN